MRTSLPPPDIERYVQGLLQNHLPDGYAWPDASKKTFATAFERVEHCFTAIDRKYYREDGQAVFDHLNGDHMATLIYFLSNTAWRDQGNEELAVRLFYLNKIMHGLDLFYSVSMPKIFMLVHPIGTVLGNAEYNDYLVVYQNCTVGAVTTTYPIFGEGTILYSRTSILGSCQLGDDVVVAANTMIIDQNVPSKTLVAGQHPNVRLLPNDRSVKARCFEATP